MYKPIILTEILKLKD